jgi:hypothetical protein
VPVLFSLRGRCATRSGLTGKQHLWFVAIQGLSLFASALEMPNSLPIPEGKQYRVRRKPLPRKNRLTMPPAQTGFAIYQVPLSRTLIFFASGLYDFYSSAFPENLLLNRKSFSENFRLRVQISRPVWLLKIPLWRRDF